MAAKKSKNAGGSGGSGPTRTITIQTVALKPNLTGLKTLVDYLKEVERAIGGTQAKLDSLLKSQPGTLVPPLAAKKEDGLPLNEPAPEAKQRGAVRIVRPEAKAEAGIPPQSTITPEELAARTFQRQQGEGKVVLAVKAGDIIATITDPPIKLLVPASMIHASVEGGPGTHLAPVSDSRPMGGGGAPPASQVVHLTEEVKRLTALQGGARQSVQQAQAEAEGFEQRAKVNPLSLTEEKLEHLRREVKRQTEELMPGETPSTAMKIHLRPDVGAAAASLTHGEAVEGLQIAANFAAANTELGRFARELHAAEARLREAVAAQSAQPASGGSSVGQVVPAAPTPAGRGAPAEPSVVTQKTRKGAAQTAPGIGRTEDELQRTTTTTERSATVRVQRALEPFKTETKTFEAGFEDAKSTQVREDAARKTAAEVRQRIQESKFALARSEPAQGGLVKLTAEEALDPRLHEPGITHVSRPESIAIQLRDLQSIPIREVFIKPLKDDIANAAAVVKRIQSESSTDPRVSLRESSGTLIGKQGLGLTRYASSPSGPVWTDVRKLLSARESGNPVSEIPRTGDSGERMTVKPPHEQLTARATAMESGAEELRRFRAAQEPKITAQKQTGLLTSIDERIAQMEKQAADLRAKAAEELQAGSAAHARSVQRYLKDLAAEDARRLSAMQKQMASESRNATTLRGGQAVTLKQAEAEAKIAELESAGFKFSTAEKMTGTAKGGGSETVERTHIGTREEAGVLTTKKFTFKEQRPVRMMREGEAPAELNPKTAPVRTLSVTEHPETFKSADAANLIADAERIQAEFKARLNRVKEVKFTPGSGNLERSKAGMAEETATQLAAFKKERASDISAKRPELSREIDERIRQLQQMSSSLRMKAAEIEEGTAKKAVEEAQKEAQAQHKLWSKRNEDVVQKLLSERKQEASGLQRQAGDIEQDLTRKGALITAAPAFKTAGGKLEARAALDEATAARMRTFLTANAPQITRAHPELKSEVEDKISFLLERAKQQRLHAAEVDAAAAKKAAQATLDAAEMEAKRVDARKKKEAKKLADELSSAEGARSVQAEAARVQSVIKKLGAEGAKIEESVDHVTEEGRKVRKRTITATQREGRVERERKFVITEAVEPQPGSPAGTQPPTGTPPMTFAELSRRAYERKAAGGAAPPGAGGPPAGGGAGTSGAGAPGDGGGRPIRVQELAQTTRQVQLFDAAGKSVGATWLANTAKAAFWASGIMALYGTLNLASKAMQVLIDTGGQTARLNQVFRGVGGSAEQLSDDVLKLAAIEGRAVGEAMEAAVQYSRLGLTRQQVNLGVRASLMAANVAEIDAAQATEHLSAIMAGYGLQVEDLGGKLGFLNAISNQNRSTNREVLEGLARSSLVAKQAGFSFEELTGILAAATAQSGLTGSSIGTAMKTVLSHLSNPDLQEKLRKQFKIEVMQGDTGDVKPGPEVLGELFTRYQQLNKAQQQNLTTQIAGATQANRLQAILDSYVKGQVLAINAQLNLNSAEQESARIRESLKSRLQGLRTEMARLTVNADAGLGFTRQLADMAEAARNVLVGLQAIGKWVPVRKVMNFITEPMVKSPTGRGGVSISPLNNAVQLINTWAEINDPELKEKLATNRTQAIEGRMGAAHQSANLLITAQRSLEDPYLPTSKRLEWVDQISDLSTMDRPAQFKAQMEQAVKRNDAPEIRRIMEGAIEGQKSQMETERVRLVENFKQRRAAVQSQMDAEPDVKPRQQQITQRLREMDKEDRRTPEAAKERARLVQEQAELARTADHRLELESKLNAISGEQADRMRKFAESWAEVHQNQMEVEAGSRTNQALLEAHRDTLSAIARIYSEIPASGALGRLDVDTAGLEQQKRFIEARQSQIKKSSMTQVRKEYLIAETDKEKETILKQLAARQDPTVRAFARQSDSNRLTREITKAQVESAAGTGSEITQFQRKQRATDSLINAKESALTSGRLNEVEQMRALVALAELRNEKEDQALESIHLRVRAAREEMEQHRKLLAASPAELIRRSVADSVVQRGVTPGQFFGYNQQFRQDVMEAQDRRRNREFIRGAPTQDQMERDMDVNEEGRRRDLQSMSRMRSLTPQSLPSPQVAAATPELEAGRLSVAFGKLTESVATAGRALQEDLMMVGGALQSFKADLATASGQLASLVPAGPGGAPFVDGIA